MKYTVWNIRRGRLYFSASGPNQGAIRLGIWIDARKGCVDINLWNDSLVKAGPEKGGLWYRSQTSLHMATPWATCTVTWQHSVPRRVHEHVRWIKRLMHERREIQHAAWAKLPG